MRELLRKHWASLLGALFVVAAFITLFQYSVEKGWITNVMKIGFGLAGGIGFAIVGAKLAQKPKGVMIGEILLGIGACILYATFSFAGIYYDMWSPLLVLLGMTAITAGITYYAHKFQSRMLMNIALLGGLLAPLLLRPDRDAVFTLFLYLLVLNVAFLYLSILKGWLELRIVGFLGSWVLYFVYFIHYLPATTGIWNMPMRYAVAVYLFYTLGLLLSSWKSKSSFEGTDLYLNAFNGVLFGVWALFIWGSTLSYGYVILGMGLLYTFSGLVISRLSGKMSVPAISFTITGVVLILMSLNTLNESVLVRVLIWTLYVALLTAIGRIWRWYPATIIAAIIWLYLGVYWYSVTWWTPRGEWFGVYIPFLNWGAIAWMALAALGFYYAKTFKVPGLSDSGVRILSRLFALFSHLIVGGLMARQIQNVFTEYLTDLPKVYMALTLSIVWGVYALILVLWGAYYREGLFKWFGSAVLVIVAIKAIFMDLSDQDALFKVIALLILGAISFAVTWINGKWQGNPPLNPGPGSPSAPGGPGWNPGNTGGMSNAGRMPNDGGMPNAGGMPNSGANPYGAAHPQHNMPVNPHAAPANWTSHQPNHQGFPPAGQPMQGQPNHQGYAPGNQGVQPNYQGYAPGNQGGHPNQQGYAPGNQGRHPNHQGYAPGNQGVHPNHQGHAPGNQGVQPNHQGYAPGNQGVYPNHQGHAPSNQGVHPNRQGYASGNQGAHPNHQGYAPGNQGGHPNQQGYAPGNQGGQINQGTAQRNANNTSTPASYPGGQDIEMDYKKGSREKNSYRNDGGSPDEGDQK
jgi:hypothetical protein